MPHVATIDLVFMPILYLLDIYQWIVIIAVVASWLIAFNVVNLYNGFVRSVVRMLDVLTEPVFGLVRRILPPIAGLDLSPLVVLFAIFYLRSTVVPWLYGLVAFS